MQKKKSKKMKAKVNLEDTQWTYLKGMQIEESEFRRNKNLFEERISDN